MEDQQQLGSEEQLHLLHWEGLRAARLEAEMEETDWRSEEVEAEILATIARGNQLFAWTDLSIALSNHI